MKRGIKTTDETGKMVLSRIREKRSRGQRPGGEEEGRGLGWMY
jgi:hypothetical protein